MGTVSKNYYAEIPHGTHMMMISSTPSGQCIYDPVGDAGELQAAMHIDELYRAHIALSYIYRVIVLSVHNRAPSATNRANKRRMLDEMPPLHGLTCENRAVETKRLCATVGRIRIVQPHQ